ncbi:MAG: 7-carboxy-7-deazaguanine synthase [Candidatus Anoxychlamydiales bacterium]|nr:7-carboxy-7-deazaguanine synthase [Candidatus Anoxychlamydiales bacterium]NGX36564.1 7-carboxy-7-deazaguanine synthase [Candidatus Anoxychlamydiales bacterium]
MLIGGLQKFSLINYPKKTSALIFTQGCGFLCQYCHNPELVLKKRFQPPIDEDTVLTFLKKRQNQLDAVVISGGEPTLQKDLIPFIKKIKDLNFLIKLDTNGIHPKIIKNLLDENLLDYIAMDIKAPLDKYKLITQLDLGLNLIEESINLIMSSNIDYEFRTTLVKNLHEIEDIEKMGLLIKGAKKYFLQSFVPKVTLNPDLSSSKAFSDEEMEDMRKTALKYVKNCFIR